MMNVVQAGGGRVWFLNDPIEDNPDHSWEDYRTNWESTLTASLLWPQVWRFEVMPWPERIFHRKYPVVDRSRRKRGEPVAREAIPPAYATELMTVITALNDMEQADIAWDCGTRGIGVVVSDSMMFQRGDPNPSDPDLGSFYGLAMPMVKHGIPAVPAQLENATIPGALKDHRVLLMTYEGMKPMKPEVHTALAAWVRQGGALVFVDDDRDPYNGVHSWWNDASKGMSYQSPREHLFEQLGLAKDAGPGTHKVGAGTVIYDASSPAGLTHRRDGADHLPRTGASRLCEAVGLDYRETNYLALRRGPYVVAAGLDESIDGRPARPPRAIHQPLRRAAADPRNRDPRARQPPPAARPRPCPRVEAGRPGLGLQDARRRGCARQVIPVLRGGAGQDRGGRPGLIAVGPGRGAPGRPAPRPRRVELGRRESDRAAPLPQRPGRSMGPGEVDGVSFETPRSTPPRWPSPRRGEVTAWPLL